MFWRENLLVFENCVLISFWFAGKFDQGWKFKGEFYVPLDDERFLEFKTTTNLNWKFVNDYEDAKCSMKIDWVNEVKFIELFALAIGMG